MPGVRAPVGVALLEERGDAFALGPFVREEADPGRQLWPGATVELAADMAAASGRARYRARCAQASAGAPAGRAPSRAASGTSITLAEIRFGIARLPAGRRKQALLDTADDTFRAFDEQILPVDAAAAEEYAIIASARERAGKPIAGFDALIAAVCRSHAGRWLASQSATKRSRRRACPCAGRRWRSRSS